MSLDPPRYGPWHLWFAWHPARTHCHGWRWLRTVERRRWFGGRSWSGWDYRPTPNNRKETA